ncbi:MAG: nuclear transport factor 2 family protein [Novosphingobium sp.]
MMRATMVLIALAAAAPAFAQGEAPPLELAGGPADYTATGEFFRDVPRAAVPQPGTACMAARRYLELVNSGRYGEMADLFTADAVVLEPMRGPSGGMARGRAEIDAFYSRRIGAMRPHVVGVAYVGNRTDCMLENAAKVPPATRYSLSSINHFTVNRQGKITRMVAFARPRG